MGTTIAAGSPCSRHSTDAISEPPATWCPPSACSSVASGSPLLSAFDPLRLRHAGGVSATRLLAELTDTTVCKSSGHGYSGLLGHVEHVSLEPGGRWYVEKTGSSGQIAVASSCMAQGRAMDGRVGRLPQAPKMSSIRGRSALFAKPSCLRS